MDFGTPLSNETIKKGLVELNPEINFDPISRLPEIWRPIMHNDGKPIAESETEGVYWGVRYVAPLDRGMVPEGEIYEDEEGIEEIPMQDFERYDGASVLFWEILPTEAGYHEALLMAQQKQDNFRIDDRGKVFKQVCIRHAVVRGRMIRYGWRNTFNAILAYMIPGVTREAIEKKFGIDLTPKLIPVESVVTL